MQMIDIHQFSSNNRGLIASEYIEKGDLLMFIPDHYLLKQDIVKTHSKIFQTLTENNIKPRMKLFAFTTYLLE